jgi:tRNA (guanine37-N1)-methyltransferase
MVKLLNMSSLKITILTLFPEYFESVLKTSILNRSQDAGVVEYQIVDIRQFAQDKHRVTDDRPFGGGPGMVMKVDPIALALDSLAGGSHQVGLPGKKTVLTSAKGRLLNQAVAREYAVLEELVIICGHYEGVDERVAEHLVDEEVRIGDYVLTGGEPAAAVIIDAVTRLLPGALGNESSTIGESHDQPGEFGHPQYTRPVEFRGWKVPDVLLTGHHAQIEEWRKNQRS